MGRVCVTTFIGPPEFQYYSLTEEERSQLWLFLLWTPQARLLCDKVSISLPWWREGWKTSFENAFWKDRTHVHTYRHTHIPAGNSNDFTPPPLQTWRCDGVTLLSLLTLIGSDLEARTQHWVVPKFRPLNVNNLLPIGSVRLVLEEPPLFYFNENSSPPINLLIRKIPSITYA